MAKRVAGREMKSMTPRTNAEFHSRGVIVNGRGMVTLSFCRWLEQDRDRWREMAREAVEACISGTYEAEQRVRSCFAAMDKGELTAKSGKDCGK